MSNEINRRQGENARKFEAPKGDNIEDPVINDIVGGVVYVGIYIDPAGGVGEPIGPKPKTDEQKKV